MKILLVASFWAITAGHDTVPNILWPLTDYTGGREVFVGGDEAVFSAPVGAGSYMPGEPHLQYQALDLTNNDVTVVLRAEVAGKFMLIGMFYLNPKRQTNVFTYESNTDIKFKLLIGNCELLVYVPLDQSPAREEIHRDDCPNSPGWYTIAVQWKDHMKIFLVFADPDEDKGKTIAEMEVKDGFTFEVLPQPGNLTVGPGGSNPGLRVCCLRVYAEEFDKSHVEAGMYDDCRAVVFWQSAEPHPCGTQPCENGGTCIAETSDYSCVCRPWFTGENCTTELWITKQDFVLMGEADLNGKLEPMTGLANLSARSETECSSRCLQINMCMSFTFGHKLCTLYDDVTQDFSGSATRYFVERSQSGVL